MSNETKALSISFRSDDGCIEHNNRDFFTDNVDKSRTPNNITYIKRDLRELYHELFDEALAEYNAKQNRPDRQIHDYYEHIRKSKKEKLFQEIIVMFGNSENCGVGSENWETAKTMLPEYYEPSVKKALAAFKPMEGRNIRERLKFFIDRILYNGHYAVQKSAQRYVRAGYFKENQVLADDKAEAG